MAKHSSKSLKASIINEVNKEYKKKYGDTIDRLKESNEYYHNVNKRLTIENNELKSENIKLKDENEKLKDWNERLMAFLDLPEDVRYEAIKEFRARRESTKKLSGLMEAFSPYFNLFNGY